MNEINPQSPGLMSALESIIGAPRRALWQGGNALMEGDPLQAAPALGGAGLGAILAMMKANPYTALLGGLAGAGAGQMFGEAAAPGRFRDVGEGASPLTKMALDPLNLLLLGGAGHGLARYGAPGELQALGRAPRALGEALSLEPQAATLADSLLAGKMGSLRPPMAGAAPALEEMAQMAQAARPRPGLRIAAPGQGAMPAVGGPGGASGVNVLGPSQASELSVGGSGLRPPGGPVFQSRFGARGVPGMEAQEMMAAPESAGPAAEQLAAAPEAAPQSLMQQMLADLEKSGAPGPAAELAQGAEEALPAGLTGGPEAQQAAQQQQAVELMRRLGGLRTEQIAQREPVLNLRKMLTDDYRQRALKGAATRKAKAASAANPAPEGASSSPVAAAAEEARATGAALPEAQAPARKVGVKKPQPPAESAAAPAPKEIQADPFEAALGEVLQPDSDRGMIQAVNALVTGHEGGVTPEQVRRLREAAQRGTARLGSHYTPKATQNILDKIDTILRVHGLL